MVKKATSPDPRPAHKPMDPKSDSGTDANDADGYSARTRQDPWVTALAIFAVGLIIWALFLGSQDSPTPNLSPREVTTAAPPSLEFALEGSEARDLIRRAAQDNTLDLEALFQRAETLRKLGKHTDAYLLYFHSARNGHGRSAFQLAEMSDPEHHNKSNTALTQPDPYQAYKWYRAAEKFGISEAQDRLRKLEKNLRTAAASDDPQAQRLLLLWR
ncbi:MAG: hypothetical protein ACFCUJ_05705 [Thiotrichales bacterium]